MPYRPCTELLCVEIYSLTVGESVIILNDEAFRNLGLITLLVCADTLPELVKELTLVVTSRLTIATVCYMELPETR